MSDATKAAPRDVNACCEACGAAARYVLRGRCANCGHVQGEPTGNPAGWPL